MVMSVDDEPLKVMVMPVKVALQRMLTAEDMLSFG